MLLHINTKFEDLAYQQDKKLNWPGKRKKSNGKKSNEIILETVLYPNHKITVSILT